MDPNHAHAPALTAAQTAVRRALTLHGNLTVPADSIADDADLYAVGLTSHATVNVMLSVEDELDVEFPDALLNRATFATVESLSAAATSAGR